MPAYAGLPGVDVVDPDREGVLAVGYLYLWILPFEVRERYDLIGDIHHGRRVVKLRPVPSFGRGVTHLVACEGPGVIVDPFVAGPDIRLLFPRHVFLLPGGLTQGESRFQLPDTGAGILERPSGRADAQRNRDDPLDTLLVKLDMVPASLLLLPTEGQKLIFYSLVVCHFPFIF